MDSGRSADRATPVTQAQINQGPTSGPSTTTGRTSGHTHLPPEIPSSLEFECRAPQCSRVFQTATGRGVHERRSHTEWYDQHHLEHHQHRKERWNDEELGLLAHSEARLLLEGVRFINQELVKTSSRTLEAIKGVRRRPEYKKKVQELLKDMRDELERGEDNNRNEEHGAQPQGNEQDELFTYLIESDPLDGEDFNARWLNNICSMVHSSPKSRVGLELAAYIRETFPPEKELKVSGKGPERSRNQNAKQKRREEFARVQDLWRRNPGECARRIMEDRLHQEKSLEKDRMVSYWQTIMTRNKTMSPKLPHPEITLDQLWAPITADEVRKALPRRKTATGPDAVSAETVWKVPRDILARIFNIIMWLGKLPDALCRSRTVLLPKKKGAQDPGSFRPISMPSVIVRTFHKALANRMKSIQLDSRQRAFRDTEGCAENVVLLDMAIRYHHRKHRKMFMAVLDMAKAFDSVSFPALFSSIKAKGIPEPMIEYIQNIYREGTTILQHGGWQSDPIHPTCGVRQGDPLSPVMFNMVIDGLLGSMKSGIGVDIDGIKLNILAFADDIVLLASTKEGLQSLIDRVADFLGRCGLEANAEKCATLAIQGVPKQKKTTINPSCTFKINKAVIPALGRSSEWTYLGVRFNVDGVRCSSESTDIQEKLEKLSKAPLKPQQRLWATRSIVIPSVMYHLVHGHIQFGHLRKLDRTIRKNIRGWLHLPKDCPNAYFHANIKDGGLGVPSLRWWAPLQRLKTLNRLRKNQYLVDNDAISYLNIEATDTEKRLKQNDNSILRTAKELDRMWSEKLYSSVDGGPLCRSAEVRGQHGWVGAPTRFLSGRDFVNCVKTRINALPSLSRTSRGRTYDRSCRAGCGVPETNNHILQVCHKTNGIRIKRHNAISNYIARNLSNQGYRVENEPTFTTSEGVRKPDVIATLGDTSFIVDTQIVGEQTDLEHINRNKINYYKNNPTLINEIKNKYGSGTVLTYAATLNWRGVWAKTSAEDLLERGIIRRKDLPVMSSRVLIGSIAAWNIFNKSTSTKRSRNEGRPRQGVG